MHFLRDREQTRHNIAHHIVAEDQELRCRCRRFQEQPCEIPIVVFIFTNTDAIREYYFESLEAEKRTHLTLDGAFRRERNVSAFGARLSLLDPESRKIHAVRDGNQLASVVLDLFLTFPLLTPSEIEKK